MKKAKRTFANTQSANCKVGRLDFSHKVFAVCHEEKTIYVLENTDAEIRNGNEVVLNKALELFDMYPNYQGAILQILVLR